MKKFYAFVTAIGISGFAMASSPGSSGSDSTNLIIKKLDESKVQMIFPSIPSSPLTVKIYDSKNFLVQQDRIVIDRPFSKAYDFSNLAPEIYTIDVFEHGERIEHFLVDMAKPISSPIAFSVVEKVEDHKYKLKYNGLSSVNLEILVFENDRLIYQEQVSDVNGFQKLYKMSGIAPQSRIEFLVKTDEGFKKLLAAR